MSEAAAAACLLLSLVTSLIAVNGAAHENHELPAMENVHNHSETRSRILKRQLNCPVGEYHTNVHCCRLCPAGTFKSSDCSQEHGSPICLPCQEELYMNIPNHDEECHRCTQCDHGEGFEMDQKCTSVQNTICQCMENYFCIATPPCKHCELCDKCENGYVKEECTRRKNTVCQDNHHFPVYAIVLIVLVIAAVAVAGYIWFRKRKRNSLTDDQPSHEEIMPLYEDVDLEPHYIDIAKNATVDDMLLLVRKNGMAEPDIDGIMQDNKNNANEQKIQLLRKWYESHGRKGAFSKLIKTFEENGNRKLAETLSQILTRASSRMASNGADPNEEHNTYSSV